jgi:Ca2+-binding EF-hand superfamily protein
MDAQGTAETTWEYLRQRYDADGDGRVSRREYTRGDDAFARLDRDGDGVLSEVDVERRGGGQRGRQRGPEAPGASPQLVLLLYMQDDDDASRLSLAELERAIVAYDGDGDGAIGRPEFEALSEKRRARLPGERADPGRIASRRAAWEAMLKAIDTDGDRRLSGAELTGCFRRSDSDGDAILLLDDVAGRGDRPERRAGPAEGEWAPDLTLRPPRGGAPVTLSGFRGARPVALIFGSYT